MKKQSPDLLSLLKKKTIVVPGVYDCLTALLAEKVGFPAAYITGAGLSVSVLGKPDIGLLTLEEVVFETKRISSAVKIPVFVDADTGYGGPHNVARAVNDLENAGAAGIQIEDQVSAKRCGHLDGKSLIKPAFMVEKIKAAVASRKSKRFAIVARTDARGVTTLRDALERAALYKRAGADIIFPEALKTKEEFAAFGRKKGLGTLMANMTEFGRSPSLTVSELAHLGYRLVLYPMTAFRVAAFAVEKALSDLLSTGSSRVWLDRMQTRKDLYKLIRYQSFNDLDAQWAKQNKLR